MHDLTWDDLYITPQEFIDLLTEAAKDSMYFNNGWDKTWHPEDLYYNMESVMEGMGNGMRAYLSLVGERVRAKKKQVPVFGGTIDEAKLDGWTRKQKPTYTNNSFKKEEVHARSNLV